MTETVQKQQVWTIQAMRRWACEFFRKNGIDTPQLDSDMLLAEALGVPRIELLINAGQALDAQTLARFKSLVIRRTREHEPMAYILGKREFWSLEFHVTADTLIPRPDTECLVEAVVEAVRMKLSAKSGSAVASEMAQDADAVAEDDGTVTYEALPDERLASYVELWAKQDAEDTVSDETREREEAIPAYDEDGHLLATRDIHDDIDPEPVESTVDEEAQNVNDDHLRIVDVGTGSGAIAIALASEFKAVPCEIVAVDISSEAIAVAQENAKRLGFPRVCFVQSDLLGSVSGTFDVIVSNPPYVTVEEYETLSPEVKREPRLALIAGKRGLDIYTRLVPEAFGRLRDNGLLAVEIGYAQADDVMALFHAAGFSEVVLKKDYADKPRVVMVYKRMQAQ